MVLVKKCKVVDIVLPFFFKSRQNVNDMSPFVSLCICTPSPQLMLSYEVNLSGSQVELNSNFQRNNPMV